MLQVAAAILDGELEYSRGNFVETFANLWLAVERDDALVYDEP